MEESAAKEIQQEVHVSIENENEMAVLVEDIMSMVESSKRSFPVSCRINRVPDQLRRVNEEAYTPRLISIGPLHHFSKKLQTMEKFKLKYLTSFLRRFKYEINLEMLLSTVKQMEKTIGYCYGETIMASMHNNDFLKIILVDAIFILELFVQSYYSGESDDILTEEAGIDLSVLKVDLVLLENQLPFFVIEELFTLAYYRDLGHRSLIELTLRFFENFNTKIIDTCEATQARRIEHFTDLFRTFLLPTSRSLPTTKSYGHAELQYSATQLEEAGLKVQVSFSGPLVDLKFRTDVNVLEIPSVQLSNLTEALFQNIIAFEQTRCAGDEFFSGYIAMLGSLIKTTKDMDLLCHSKIVDNRFHDRYAALLVVKKLSSSILRRANGSYNFMALNDFVYDHSWRIQLHAWVKTLKLDYFSNPWKSAGTIAGITLLVLTFIQTVCSILQVK